MRLTQEQVGHISDFLDQEGIKIPSLKDDILDHICCVIESRLGEGHSFDELLLDAVSDLAPNGLINIEQNTIFLLNSKRILMMKKLMYLIGLLGSIALTAGITFKLLWFPGANVLLVLGFFSLLFGFIPMYTIDRYKVAISKAISERMKIILGAVAVIIIGAAVLFKIMHFQGANVLLVLGAFVFAFGFLPFWFFTMYKKAIV